VLIDEAINVGGASLPVQSAKSGEPDERILDLVLQPIRDSTKEVVGIFVEGFDITDRVIAERP
jgi:hypothetical protein